MLKEDLWIQNRMNSISKEKVKLGNHIKTLEQQLKRLDDEKKLLQDMLDLKKKYDVEYVGKK